MEFKIIKEVQQNGFNNPEKSSNGGGYDQPYIEFEVDGIFGYLCDQDCGDFGQRFGLYIDPESEDRKFLVVDQVDSPMTLESNFCLKKDKKLLELLEDKLERGFIYWIESFYEIEEVREEEEWN